MPNYDKDFGKTMEKKIAFVLMRSGVPQYAIDDVIRWAFGEDAWIVNMGCSAYV